MGLNKFLFPNRLVQAHELGRVKRAQRRSAQRRAQTVRDSKERFQALEEDLGYVTLVLGALLQKLDDAGTVTRSEVQDLMADLDSLDGVQDGRLDVDVLKGLDEEG